MNRSPVTWTLCVLALSTTATGCIYSAEKQPVIQHPALEANSCSIRCPADSAYSGMGGSVTCTSFSSPVCQCANAKQKMAYCEITPSP
jgi:hypothetical protein